MVMLSTRVSELDLDDFDGQLTQIICLSNISWQTYQTMLSEMGDHRATRIAYDQGTLTIKMPSKLHEVIKCLLARIVIALTEELDLGIISIGSTTLERDDLKKGAEPDSGFYIQSVDKLKGLAPETPTELPPDLVIEVDITSPSTQRMTIYRALGVAELWRYTKRSGVTIYHLSAEGYSEKSSSKAFPRLTALKLNEFLSQHQHQNENQVIRSVRSWIQSLE